ncbi:MAG: pseudouridine synthase [Promethearchaeota archaeon]|nr:MAG: pseudouridine synthase [Candidatus Lokiarchaeota archaeon]
MNNVLDLRKLKAISDHQFGKQITDIIFGDWENLNIKKSIKTSKIRYVFWREQLYLTLRPNNGFFTLSLHSAEKILQHVPSPKLRAIVPSEISEFIKKGRNVFCKHIIDIDESLRPLDEVIVVDEDDNLLAIGRVKIPVPYIKTFKSGVGINIRKGINKLKVKNHN